VADGTACDCDTAPGACRAGSCECPGVDAGADDGSAADARGDAGTDVAPRGCNCATAGRRAAPPSLLLLALAPLLRRRRHQIGHPPGAESAIHTPPTQRRAMFGSQP
jgi:MYXO-CTERM domain-containing protein